MIVVAVCSVEKYKSVSAASLSQKTSNPLENLDCMFLHNFLRVLFFFGGGHLLADQAEPKKWHIYTFGKWTRVTPFSSPLVPLESLWVGHVSMLLPNKHCQNTEGNSKHWSQPVDWPHPFFIPHQTPDVRLEGELLSHAAYSTPYQTACMFLSAFDQD